MFPGRENNGNESLCLLGDVSYASVLTKNGRTCWILNRGAELFEQLA